MCIKAELFHPTEEHSLLVAQVQTTYATYGKDGIHARIRGGAYSVFTVSSGDTSLDHRQSKDSAIRSFYLANRRLQGC